MENYSYQTYPDSGESSPRSREIEFENPPPWVDDPNYKAKFLCSYGGKIQPRSHDNQLSYVGGDTKILAVDRSIKFPAMISKLSAVCNCNDSDLSFKYQLPGEDLDALISVTNDDDLDHMMHEYDRLYRGSARPARMRLFLFVSDPVPPDPVKQPSKVDFLFGLENKGLVAAAPPSQPPVVKFRDPVPEPVVPTQEYQTRPAPNVSDRVVVSDPNVNHPIEIQRQLQQDFQRLQIGENEPVSYRRKSDENLAGNYHAGDYYVQKPPEKFPPSSFPTPASQQGYWPEKHVSGEAYQPTVTAPGGGDQPVYMFPAPGTFYHAPVVRPPATQGYYTVQRMPSDIAYREPPVYGGAPLPRQPHASAVPATLAPAQPVKAPAYTEGFNMVRPAGMPDNTSAGYAQVAYDSASGRQVYYTAPGGVVHPPPYHGMAHPVTADMRPAGVSSLGQDVKVINKVSQGSV